LMPLDRSDLMRRIREKYFPELRVRRMIWRLGLRYRVHSRIGRARPDILFIRPRVAVFVDGCFWHGCPKHYVRPRSRALSAADKLPLKRTARLHADRAARAPELDHLAVLGTSDRVGDRPGRLASTCFDQTQQASCPTANLMGRSIRQRYFGK
jgi:DNA mismatch endonuclease Vsr